MMNGSTHGLPLLYGRLPKHYASQNDSLDLPRLCGARVVFFGLTPGPASFGTVIFSSTRSV
jgi:hypothetical protein